MKKIHLLIIRSYIWPFILTFFIAEFVLIIQFFFVYMDDLMGKGVEMSVILELLFYASAEVVPMALPLAVLLSSIMTMGNLAEKSELTAMKAAGMSLFKIMRPLIVFMFFVSCISFYFSNNIWGEAYLKKRILITDLTKKKLSLILNEGVFFNEIENTSIRATRIDKQNNLLYDVLIYDYNHDFRFRKVVRAEKGEMKKSDDGNDLVLTLYNGEINEVMDPGASFDKKNTKPHQKINFKKTTQKLDISSLQFNRTSEEDYTKQIHTFSVTELSRSIDSLNKDFDTIKSKLGTYFFNGYLPTRIEGQYNYDSILTSANYFEKLELEKQKRAVSNGKNKIKNAISYIDNRKEEFENREKYIKRAEIEWYRKFTLSFACLVLFFVGAPLGAIVKKGGFGFPMLISIGLFLVYHILSITGEKLAKNLVWDPSFGMWLSSLILLPLGLVLTYMAATESKIFSKETYTKLFSRIFRRKGNQL